MSMHALALRYVAVRAGRGEFRPRTAETVRNELAAFADAVGGVPVKAINARQVQHWWDGLSVNPATARNRLSIVRTFFAWCIATGRHPGPDPTRGIKAPKDPRRIPRTVPHDSVTAILQCCTTEREVLIVMLMVHMGLRCAEVAGLQVGDIDRDRRMVRVDGKGGHVRLLPIPEEAWSALRRYLIVAPATSGPLIRSHQSRGGPIRPATISRLVATIMGDAQVKEMPFDGLSAHGLRRTCATDLLDGGAHIRQVQAVLGHASLATTERYLRMADALELGPVMDGRRYIA